MLRHLGLIAVCACFVASVGCDDGKVREFEGLAAPTPPPESLVRVEFGGRVVNADAGGPVANVRVSLYSWSGIGDVSTAMRHANTQATATSGGDGTFTLPLNLPMGWSSADLQLTAPPGYDDRFQRFERTTAAGRPAIGMYPTLMIRPGETIEVRVDTGIAGCDEWGRDRFPCRRVLVAASPGDSVELELVPGDSSMPMGLFLVGGGFP
jgi:hypothetical protein